MDGKRGRESIGINPGGVTRRKDVVELCHDICDGKLVILAFFLQRLVTMNMPLTKDGMVDFNATLFGLVRSSLNIKKPEGKLRFKPSNFTSFIRGVVVSR